MLATPLPRQGKGVELARTRPRYLFAWKMGAGKTLLVYFIQHAIPKPTLIVCPKTIMRSAWLKDAVEKAGRSLTVYHGERKDRIALRRPYSAGRPLPADLMWVTNFDTFRNDIDDLRGMGFKRLCIDESSMIRNRATKSAQAVHQFADAMESVYCLSGIPAPNCPSEYWSQLRALSPHPKGPAGHPFNNRERVASFWSWAGYWLDPQTRQIRVPQKRNGRVVMDGSGRPVMEMKAITVNYKIKPSRRADWDRMLAQWMWVVETRECAEIPAERSIDVPVELSPKERAAFIRAASDLAIMDTSGVEWKFHANAKLMKLRQITGGAVKVGDGETWTPIGDAKIRAMTDLLEGHGLLPVVVWTQFHAEADRVSDAIAAMDGRKVGICDGRQKDNSATIAAFVAGDLNALVCHPRSVGHGVTLVRSGDLPCCTDIIFSFDHSYDYLAQLMARTCRTGQTEKVTHYFLVATNTTDARILQSARTKEADDVAIRAAIQVAREIVANETR